MSYENNDDEDDDYMSDKLLSKIDDTRPGLLSRSQIRKHELEKKQEIKNDLNKLKNQPIKIVEEKNRNEGLAKSIISDDSKGLNMMKKMGFKIGESLGKRSGTAAAAASGIIEPISIKIKTDREGLGRDEVKKRKLEEIEEKNKNLLKQRLTADEFNKNIYITSKKQLFHLKQLKKYLLKAQNICYQLDSNKDITKPVNNWFWPVKVLKSSRVDENEDSKSKDSEDSRKELEYKDEENDEIESVAKDIEEEEGDDDDDNEEMGTCSSHPHRPHEQLEFKVYNVDAKLLKHSKGIIKITNNDMELHQPNRPPIVWPLNGIRRYGCYRDIFLLECGRKCATGEGLFAFKCRKAQRLHDTLHVALMRKDTGLIKLSTGNNTNNACAIPSVLPIASNDANHTNGNLINGSVYANGNGNLSNHRQESLEISDDNEGEHHNGNQINTDRTPVYVNDPGFSSILPTDNQNCSLVRLPANINNGTNNDIQYREIKYIHSMIFKTNNNDINNNTNSNNNNNQDDNSDSSRRSLDYVIPGNLDREKAPTPISPRKLNESNGETSAATGSSNIDYTLVNISKTNALKESTINNQQKRDQYFRLNQVNSNGGVASNRHNSNSIFQTLD